MSGSEPRDSRHPHRTLGFAYDAQPRLLAVMLDPDFLPHLIQPLWLDSALHGDAPSSKRVGAIRASARLTSNDLQKHERISHQILRNLKYQFWWLICFSPLKS